MRQKEKERTNGQMSVQANEPARNDEKKKNCSYTQLGAVKEADVEMSIVLFESGKFI